MKTISGILLSASLLIMASQASFAQDSKCSDMTKFQIPGSGMTITKAEKVIASTPAAGARGNAAPLPAHCRVDGIIDKRIGAEGKEYGIGFAVALPDAWNETL